MPKTIYLVMARDFDSSVPVKAFERLSDATLFEEKCTAHHRLEPRAPATSVYVDQENPESKAVLETYWRKHEIWRDGHPAGGHYSCEYFAVQPMDLVLAEE